MREAIILALVAGFWMCVMMIVYERHIDWVGTFGAECFPNDTCRDGLRCQQEGKKSVCGK